MACYQTTGGGGDGGGGGGGGGFFLACGDFVGRFDDSFPARVLSLLFFRMEMARAQNSIF